MPSPFPGMNPYLEQADAWEEIHHRYITVMARALGRSVGENYFVKVEVRLYLHELSAEEQRYFGKADVGVSITRASPSKGSSPAGLSAPFPLRLPNIEEERQAYLEIRDRRQPRVVTTIELLSPTNKTPGPYRDEYVGKRMVMLSGSMHFVEIDLRRGGQRPHPPILPPCDYYALVSRAQDRPDAGMWPISLRDPLPVIPIPLTSPDADAVLDLQTCLHEVYDDADYGRYIYSDTPEPPLNKEDLAWAKSLVPAIP